MKRIQPFTIGTKLSVPSESKGLDSVALDSCEVKVPEERLSEGSTSLEDAEEDERDLESPSAASRSIRKIAMCSTSESHESPTTSSSTEKPFPAEETASDTSGPVSENEMWTRGRKTTRILHCDCCIPAFPQYQPEDTSPSQRRDLKDFENSLIQLSASLDMMQEEPRRTLQKSTDAADVHLEALRRKQSPGDHPDKAWLKLKSLLRDYHQDVLLALDVSSFYQHADAILSAIRSKTLMADVQQEKESRELACQINMLNESASRLSNLHPTLARRVTCKQAEVKEHWALLQESVRSQKTSLDSHSFAKNDSHGVMGKDVKEEQNRLRGFECSRPQRTWSPTDDCSARTLTESSDATSSNGCSKHPDPDGESCPGHMTQTTLKDPQRTNKLLKKPMTPIAMSQYVAFGESPNSLKQSQDHDRDLLCQQKENQESEQAEDQATKMAPEVPRLHHLTENLEEESSGMMEKFFELLNPNGFQKVCWEFSGSRQDLAMDTQISTDQVCDRPDREHEHVQRTHQTTEELQSLLSTLTPRINQHLCRCAELSMDVLDIETDMTVLCEGDLQDLEALREQQRDLEFHYSILEEEVRRMERLASEMKMSMEERRKAGREDVHEILQAWEELGRNLCENQARLEKLMQIQEFYENYISLITWTEKTRASLVTRSSDWGESEVGEMDQDMEEKLVEFSTLTAAAQKLLTDQSQLKVTIKERTDELQSMLGWLQVNWCAERKQIRMTRNWPPDLSNHPPLPHPSWKPQCIVNEETKVAAENHLPPNIWKQTGVVSQETCLPKTSVGSSICLILSLDDQSAGINQVTKQTSPNSSQGSITNHLSSHQDAEKLLHEPIEKPTGERISPIFGNHFPESVQSTSERADADQMIESEQINSNQERRRSSQRSLASDPRTSDRRRHRVPAEVTHRVVTYLHVSDSSRAPGAVSEDGSDSHVIGKDSASASAASASCSSSVDFSSCVSECEAVLDAQDDVLMQKAPVGIKNGLRRSTLSIVGLRTQGKLPAFRPRSHTWPEMERSRPQSPLDYERHASWNKSTILVESNTVADLNDSSTANAPNEPVKNICSYLSLGSTLRFTLPNRFHHPVESCPEAHADPCHQTSVLESREAVEEADTEQVQRAFTATDDQQTIDSIGRHEADIERERQSRHHDRSSACGHGCVSVHTKIHQLNGHIYHSSQSLKVNAGQDSHRRSRVIHCGLRNCSVCCGEDDDDDVEELLQPGHWMFQQEEEELEDIWRGILGSSNAAVETKMERGAEMPINTRRGNVAHPLHG